MITHIVQIKPRNIRAFSINQLVAANQPDARRIAYCQEEIPQRQFEVANYANWSNIQQVFCEDEASAEAAAKVMSYFHPGEEVYISKISTMWTAKPSAPLAVSVSEKGMVPR